MRKRKLLAVILALTTALLTGCVLNATPRTLYEHALLTLGAGEYGVARTYFSQLGEYRDAAEYALYAGALEAWAEGDTALARRTLESLHPFKSSGRYLTYLDALEAEERGDEDTALTLFRSLGTFGDSAARAEKLGERLSTALRTTYEQAAASYEAGDFPAALAGYRASGDMLDAPERAALCEELIYRLCEAAYPDATLTEAAGLMAWYGAVPGKGEVEAHLAALHERFDTRLALMDAAAQGQPWVLYTPEGGTQQLYQVSALEGTLATLTRQTGSAAASLPLMLAMRTASPAVSTLETQTVDLNALVLTGGTGTETDPFR